MDTKNRVRVFIAGVVIFLIGLAIVLVNLTKTKHVPTIPEQIGRAAREFKQEFNRGFYGPDSTKTDSLKKDTLWHRNQ